MFEVTSTHFLPGCSFTRFADWHFVHRAWLNCVPLNGAVRHGKQDKHCRKCDYPNETLSHVLCGCQHHSAAWWHRHNATQNWLVKAIPPSLGKITVDSAIPEPDSQLRPDIVVTNVEKKKVLMVDVTVPFENGSPAFLEA